MAKTIYDYLPEILGNIEKPVIVEIGVHICQDTEKLLSLFPNSIYYGFECDPRNIETIKSHGAYRRIHLIEMGISNFNGDADFYQSNGTPKTHSRNNTASSSLHKPTGHLDHWPWVKFDDPIKVPVCTLDSFCDEQRITRIDFIWADIQGAEYDMILGGQKAFEKVKYLYTEYSNKEMYSGQKKLDDILEALPGQWEVVTDFRSDVLLKNTDYGKR
jgi:FkbM family methyltransferase